MSRTKEQVRFRDVRPYFIPNSLDDLNGPEDGVIQLPINVRWSPNRKVDLGTRAGIRIAYQALLSEGEVSDQIKYLNKERLISSWDDLSLDPRVTQMWESKFPQLKA